MENLFLPEVDLAHPPEFANFTQYSYWALQNPDTPNYMILPYFWTADQCKEIIKLGRSFTRREAQTGSGSAGVVNPEIRRSINSWLAPSDLTRWVYEKAQAGIEQVNQTFGFDLHSLENLQYTEYHESYNGTYGAHMDRFPSAVTPNSHRKLTFTIQLTDPSKYQGGDLCLYETLKPLPAPKDIGTMIFFPSYLIHEVQPVTKNKRCSLVGWVNGPKFK